MYTYFSSSSSILHPRMFILVGILLCVKCASNEDGSTKNSPHSENSSANDTGLSETNTVTEIELTETDSTTETGSKVCTDHAYVDDCCCFEPLSDDSDFPDYVDVTCPSKSLCPSFTISCGDPNEYQSQEPCTSVTNKEALDCMFMALANDEPGTLSVFFENMDFPGFWGEALILQLRGDGTVYHRTDYFYDLAGEIGGVMRHTLKPSTVFLGCMSESSVDKQAKCLQSVWVGSPIEQCTYGVGYSIDGV